MTDIEDRTQEQARRPLEILRSLLRVGWTRLLIISLGINVLLAELLLLALTNTMRDKLELIAGVYLLSMVVLSVLGATLFAVLAAGAVGSHQLKLSLGGWALILLGLAFNVISTGCPACPAPLLEKVGIVDGLAAYPLGGLEIKLFSVLLLGYVLWSALRPSRNILTLSPSPDQTQPDFRPVGSARIGARVTQLSLGVASILTFFLLPVLPPAMKIQFDPNPVDSSSVSTSGSVDIAKLYDQVNPPDGYELPVTYGELGPMLLEAGAIDLDQLEGLYAASGVPLIGLQRTILTEGSEERIVITRENARFMLHFFWALGLANQNPILDNGPLQTNSGGDIGRFASTGGWSLGQKPATELYSSAAIIPLSSDQQARVEQVAAQVYRPCCNNATIFPDCNHGMAMLGLLELLSASDVSEEKMLEAAKYVNAFWFPQQALEVGLFIQVTQGLDFDSIDASLAVGPELFSAAGYSNVNAWLADAGLLDQGAGRGSNCGV